MAIFLALIFQLLFVLFSMSINVALMVHDKINLQNAVDLAAYYAAQRQAEILNVIAHQNYQIRQAWKLLTWRYRVTGALGISNHPVRQIGSNPNPRDGSLFIPQGSGGGNHPAICMVHKYNLSTTQADGSSENLCQKMDFEIPELPIIPIIVPSPFNAALSRYRDQLQTRMQSICDGFGAYNWWYALNILTSYRYEQAERKKLIRKLAENLQGDPNSGDFKDIYGNSVLEGVKKVFFKNLSFSNAMAFKKNEDSLMLLNSFQGLRRENWLPEILVSPTLPYVDPSNGSSCNSLIKLIHEEPDRPSARQVAQNLRAYQLWNMAKGEPSPRSPFHMSVGVEKNPWYLSYVGVKAMTRPRQLFWPVGPSFQLRARALAKPFGGRIGPWYAHKWPSSARHSSGKPVDALLPNRILYKGGGSHPKSNQGRRFPNYSRYPGDPLGLMSRLALVGAASQALWAPTLNKFTFKYKYFFDIASYPPADILAWDPDQKNSPPIYRFYEMAAISPDLFDMTFYSIALNGDFYYQTLINNKNKLGLSGVFIKPDLGSRFPRRIFNVKQQISTATNPPYKRHPKAYWFAFKPEHLLTSWTSQNKAIDYSFPSSRFGQCGRFDKGLSAKIPNSCVAEGGRSGYSVKMVSRSALLRSSFQLGGVGEGAAPIQNPPPKNF